MSKPPEKVERPTFSDAEIAKARQWFAKGQELAAKKNFDYAIESYIRGLEFWPDAVEEGHKPCRAASLFRGQQKIGLKDQMKYKTGGKDPKQSMLNAEMLLSKDSKNIGYMEVMLKSAAKARFDETVMWIGDLLAEAALREEKPNPARFDLMRQVFEELGAQSADSDPAMAIAALDRAVLAQTRLRTFKPGDMAVTNDLRDLASKLTILKGKYSTADSFRDSVHDSAGQREMHDKDRIVQSDVRMDELLASAKKRYEGEPTGSHAINDYVDLLCRREDEVEEKLAIKILLGAFEATKEYRYRMRAEDIRLRQLQRRLRALEAQNDPAVPQAQKELLESRIKVFAKRTSQYPTDMRLKYQYGKLLFEGGRLIDPVNYDEAIPVLQEARADPKARHHCSLYLGRCFFEKNYFDQAAEVFKEGISNYEIPDDDLGKEMHYWLGRSYEAGGQKPDALKIYGQLIQWDYNYRKGDVRKRIDDLRRGGGSS